MTKTKMYIKDPNQTLTAKLTIVKAVKQLTELGLKDAKHICDELFEINLPRNRGRFIKDYVELEIPNNEQNHQEQIDILLENNVVVSNIVDMRDNAMEDLLKLFEIRFIRNDSRYVILDGSYVIENGVVKISITEGKNIGPSISESREINDVTLTLSLSEVVIEDYS